MASSPFMPPQGPGFFGTKVGFDQTPSTYEYVFILLIYILYFVLGVHIATHNNSSGTNSLLLSYTQYHSTCENVMDYGECIGHFHMSTP